MARPVENTRNYYAILEYLTEYINKYGYSPSVDEMVAHTGISSKSIIWYYINRMEKEGVITRKKNQARSIKIVGHNQIASLKKIISNQEKTIEELQNKLRYHDNHRKY